jgi:hypothetical protein
MPLSASTPGPRAWEDTLGALALRFPAEGQLADELKQDPGLEIIGELVDEARAGLLSAGLRLTIRLLLLELGEAQLRTFLKSFWASAPPHAFAADEASAFGAYLRNSELELPFLHDVLSFEMALLRAAVADETVTLDFHADPAELLGALDLGRLPTTIATGHYPVEVSGGR